MVRLQALIHHRALERIVVDRDNRPRRRLMARRIPGRLAGDQEDEVGILDEWRDPLAEKQRVVLRDIGEGGAAAAADRHAEELGKGDERGKALRVTAGAVGYDDRVFRGDQQFGDPRDLAFRRLRPRRRRDPAHRRGRRPGLQHGFERYVQIDRPFRGPLREFAGAHDMLVERVDASDLARPFGHRLDEALRAADDAEAPIPLRLDREPRILAETQRLARHHDHRHLGEHRRVQAGGALQQPGAGVQQHCLRASGRLRVAHRHIDGERLVPAINVVRPGFLVDLLACQRLPDRRPFRSRRGDHVIDPEIAEGFEDCFAAVAILLHDRSSPQAKSRHHSMPAEAGRAAVALAVRRIATGRDAQGKAAIKAPACVRFPRLAGLHRAGGGA